MPKRKPGAQICVADGAGGMRRVADLRFEAGEWPIELVVPAKDAKTWMAHLNAEKEERGWSSSGLSQLESAENSGTLSVHTVGGPLPPSLDIVWERSRDAELRVKARPSGTPELSLETAQDFIDATSARQRAGKTIRGHRWGLLSYYGLPWRGELWLESQLRIGPPSKHPTDALLGSQAIVVDAIVEGIGNQGVTANFETRLHEVRIFLSVVLDLNVIISKSEREWVCQLDEQGRITDCKIGQVGYAEISKTRELPSVGSTPPVERREVSRPGLGPTGLQWDMYEQWVPADIEDLWRMFTELPASKRDHFLRAGNAYLIARSMWPDQRTAYAVFLVVACEALKSSGKRYDRANVYDVVASLMNPEEGERLRRLAVPPQRVRSKHVHRGELAANELLPLLINNPFEDPSFDEMIGELSRVTRVCLTEWLRCGGNYRLVRLPRRKHTLAERIRARVNAVFHWITRRS
ncbi:MAG: hypothetical protein O6944_02895 [Gammaproteobacteria bacterium]|nr:hypothetical protein [Gammaproteobacteria bacterium]